MCNSLLKEFRFKIGEQYELNEFNLQTLKSTFSNGLEFENYKYIKGDFETLFRVPFSGNPILQYNGDILYSVICEFESSHYSYLKSKVNQCTFKEVIVEVLVKDKSSCQLILMKK
ncbi:hypothetical protein [Lacinutrix sp. MEBiC02595]